MGYITLQKVENYIFGFEKKKIHISIDIEVYNLVGRRAIDDFQVDERCLNNNVIVGSIRINHSFSF